MPTDDLLGWFGIRAVEGVVREMIWESDYLRGGIPREIRSLSGLTVLDFANNRLEGSIPQEIGDLTGLTTLHLHCNSLEGLYPPR